MCVSPTKSDGAVARDYLYWDSGFRLILCVATGKGDAEVFCFRLCSARGNGPSRPCEPSANWAVARDHDRPGSDRPMANSAAFSSFPNECVKHSRRFKSDALIDGDGAVVGFGYCQGDEAETAAAEIPS